MWLVLGRHPLIGRTHGTFRRRTPRLKIIFYSLLTCILILLDQRTNNQNLTIQHSSMTTYTWVSTIRVCFLEHAGRKDAHRAMNILYAEDIPDLDCLFTAGRTSPVPDAIPILRSQLCDALIAPAATQTVDAHMVVAPLMNGCTFRIGWLGGPRSGKVIRDATTFKDALDLGHAS
jgi:hypothetical protein